MKKWLSQEQATEALGIRRQTLYAYVSRGRVGVAEDPDNPARRLYNPEDIEALLTKRKRGRARENIAASTISWGEPIINTHISTISQGRLFYRGRDAVRLSDHATLEDAAQLLWETEEPPHFPCCAPPVAGTLRAAAYASLGAAAEASPPAPILTRESLFREAAGLVGRLASCFVDIGDDPAPLHLRIARAWGCGDRADLIRKALVLLADQELTTSAFAVRVTASTGTSLGASALAGLAALSGPLHGDATSRVQGLFDEVRQIGPEQAARRWMATGHPLPGFGHPLYPAGDPRAADLLSRFQPDPQISALVEYVGAVTGQKPTIDVALAALTAHCALPREAAFALFSTGRIVGWMAHALEQIETGSLIRPRAHYIGPALENPAKAP